MRPLASLSFAAFLALGAVLPFTFGSAVARDGENTADAIEFGTEVLEQIIENSDGEDDGASDSRCEHWADLCEDGNRRACRRYRAHDCGD